MKKIIGLCCLMASLAHGSENVEYCKVDYAEAGNVKGVYRGQCLDDVPQGVGTVSFFNGDTLEGHFEKGVVVGKSTLRRARGDIYTGVIVDGKREGQGSYQWAQGSRYEGEWADDMRHGQGVFTWNNGSRFEGEFRANKRYTGKFYSSNGRVVRCRMGACQ